MLVPEYIYPKCIWLMTSVVWLHNRGGRNMEKNQCGLWFLLIQYEQNRIVPDNPTYAGLKVLLHVRLLWQIHTTLCKSSLFALIQTSLRISDSVI